MAIRLVLLGRASQNSNRTFEAVKQFQQALAIDPKLPLAHYHLGYAYGSLGRADEALHEFEAEIKNGTRNAQVFLELARLQLEKGEASAAATNCGIARRLDPQLAGTYYIEAKAL